MSLKPYAEKGNTLSEYGMIAGLGVILAIGGLNLFGGSVLKMLDAPATQHSQDMQKMAVLDFSSGDKVQAGTSGGGSGGGGGGGTPDQNAPITNSLMSSDSSGGGNATSQEGVMGTLKSSFSVAKKMTAKAASISNNELADWYREAARYSYRLIGSEATFSYKQDSKNYSGLTPLLEKGLGAGDGLRGMYEMRKELTKKIGQLGPIDRFTPAEKKEAGSLAQQMINELDSQYGALLNKYTDGNNFKLNEVKADFGSGDLQYQKDNLYDVAQGVLGSQSGSTLTTGLATSVTIDEKTP